MLKKIYLNLEERKIYIKKHKNFLPKNYILSYNKKMKKRIGVYLLVLSLINLLFYANIKVKNNYIKDEIEKKRDFKKELFLDGDILGAIEKIDGLLLNPKVLNLTLENSSLEIEVERLYKDYIVNNFYDIGVDIKNISLGEEKDTYLIKGELR